MRPPWRPQKGILVDCSGTPKMRQHNLSGEFFSIWYEHTFIGVPRHHSRVTVRITLSTAYQQECNIIIIEISAFTVHKGFTQLGMPYNTITRICIESWKNYEGVQIYQTVKDAYHGRPLSYTKHDLSRRKTQILARSSHSFTFNRQNPSFSTYYM